MACLDLEADPKEIRNLAYDPTNPYVLNSSYTGITGDLLKLVMRWQRSIDDPVLRPEFTPLEPANRRAEHEVHPRQ